MIHCGLEQELERYRIRSVVVRLCPLIQHFVQFSKKVSKVLEDREE